MSHPIMLSSPSYNRRELAISFIIALFLLLACLTPAYAVAAELEVSGWIPYWSGTKGPKDVQKHLNALSEIHPFGYSIKEDGTLHNLVDIENSSWEKLILRAREGDVLVSPTITTSDGALVHELLSDEEKREKHIAEIIEMVEEGGYDGVNIDYEGKKTETKEYFSLFLRELKSALREKRLSCAIEARTPPDSLYKTVPENLEYANDYKQIGLSCDVVEIMAYDQQRADIKLNNTRRGMPYMPVADVDWVRKVVNLAAITIPEEKIILGIPTYGTEYEVTVSPNWFQDYKRVRALNPDAATALAKKQKVKMSRNSAGEMAFSYATDATSSKVKGYKVPSRTPGGNKVAAQALAYANKTGKTTYFNVVSWSDADAIEAKVKLARELDLRGVAIFKFDGEEDPDLWDLFEE
ncbi:hypothetical protein HY416_03850 [Candidatus Kaiserbacteria bacterium]|nr:hypothetical protein [Candidatus Kaiserbacteria bacterium]